MQMYHFAQVSLPSIADYECFATSAGVARGTISGEAHRASYGVRSGEDTTITSPGACLHRNTPDEVELWC